VPEFETGMIYVSDESTVEDAFGEVRKIAAYLPNKKPQFILRKTMFAGPFWLTDAINLKQIRKACDSNDFGLLAGFYGAEVAEEMIDGYNDPDAALAFVYDETEGPNGETTAVFFAGKEADIHKTVADRLEVESLQPVSSVPHPTVQRLEAVIALIKQTSDDNQKGNREN
jgi:hypothetical protein